MSLWHFEKLNVERLGSCRNLVLQYPYSPFYYYSWSASDSRADCMLQQLADAIGSPGHCCIAEKQGHGLVLLGKSPWETEVLGMACGFVGPLVVDERQEAALNLRRELLRQALEWHRSAGSVHVTARIDANEMELLHLLEATGFIIVDEILHFSLDLADYRPGDEKPAAASVQCRLHQEKDIPALRSIAENAFRYDRFHSDPVIDPGIADRAYGKWIENSCRGLDDAVVVAECENKSVGFMTLRILPGSQRLGKKIGKIWLVAVAEQMRGRNVGKELMRFSLDWFRISGVDVVEVGTQLRNHSGMAFYARNGFTPIHPVLALRKLAG